MNRIPSLHSNLCAKGMAHKRRGACSSVQLALLLYLTTLGFVLLMSPLTHTQGLQGDLCLSPVDSKVCLLMTSLLRLCLHVSTEGVIFNIGWM